MPSNKSQKLLGTKAGRRFRNQDLSLAQTFDSIVVLT